jgi:DNA replication protein DnaC
MPEGEDGTRTPRTRRPWENIPPRTCGCKSGRFFDEAGQMTYCTCYEGLRERESDEKWERIRRENRERSLWNCFQDGDEEVSAFTWETYPAEGDRDVLAFLRDYASTWDGKRGLILRGGIGGGKTILMTCLFKDLIPVVVDLPRASARLCRARFAPMVKILSELRGTFGRQEQGEPSFSKVLEEYRDAYLLCIDDVGVEKVTGFVQEQFYSIVNERAWRGLPTFMTTNLSEDELRAHLTPRVFSRLLPKVDIVEVISPDLRELAAEQQREGK